MKSIRTQLIIAFSVLISSCIIILCTVGYFKAKNNLQSVTYTQNNDMVTGDIEVFKSYIKDSYGKITVKDGELMDEKGEKIKDNQGAIEKISKDLSINATVFQKKDNDFIRTSTNLVNATGTKLDNNTDSYKNLIKGEKYFGDTVINDKEYSCYYEVLKNDNGDIIGAIFIGKSKDKVNTLIADGLNSLCTTYIILGIIFIIITIVITYFIGTMITSGLSKGVEYSKCIQNLDVSKEIPQNLKKARGEVGILLDSMQSATKILRDFLKNTDISSKNMEEYCKTLLLGIDQINLAGKDISNVVEGIAEASTKQAKETELGALKANDLASCTEDTKNYLDLLTKQMQEVGDSRREGVVAINNLSQESERINKAAGEIAEVIVDTNNKANEIEQASDMIKKIAKQTQLLSLNAAIEAARAGEEGRGFTVVAEEIRKLADESSKFTEEIKTVIKELTNKTSNAVATMSSIDTMMDSQQKSVQTTIDKFSNISSSVENSIKTLRDLNESSKKMQKGEEDIIEIMENLASFAEENAACSEEVASSVEEQMATIEQFDMSIRNLVKLADTMKLEVSKFKY